MQKSKKKSLYSDTNQWFLNNELIKAILKWLLLIGKNGDIILSLTNVNHLDCALN